MPTGPTIPQPYDPSDVSDVDSVVVKGPETQTTSTDGQLDLQSLPWNQAVSKSNPVVPGVNASPVDARPEEQPAANTQSGTQQTNEKNPPPPPPRTPSEAQRYNSAARTHGTTVGMFNPRGLGRQSLIRQSHQNIVPGSLQAKVEAERAIGKSDPWSGWNVARNEVRPALHSIKGKDGTTYYQQVDGKAGTARYWSVDSSGNRTEYTGDDKVSARDQMNEARKQRDLEVKKKYWRSRGVRFGETDEEGRSTGRFEDLTPEGARAEYERMFGERERALQRRRFDTDSTVWHDFADNGAGTGVVSPEIREERKSIDLAERNLDDERLAWSRSGEGRGSYNWVDKTNQDPVAVMGRSDATSIDWDEAGQRYVITKRNDEARGRYASDINSRFGALREHSRRKQEQERRATEITEQYLRDNPSAVEDYYKKEREKREREKHPPR